MTLLNYFPKDFKPRPQQTEILKQLDKCLKDETKYIVVQAPTGSGKSHIAATLANSTNAPDEKFVELADSYELYSKGASNAYKHQDIWDEISPFGVATLTVTKSLQDQYETLFSNSQVVKGKQNYVCKVDSDYDCDIAPCTTAPHIMTKCKKLNICPFLNARRETLKSKFGVYNYDAFFMLPHFLQQKQIIICDEASELEDKIVGYFSCTVGYGGKWKDLGIDILRTEDRILAFNWLNDVANVVKKKITELSGQLKTKKTKRTKKSVVTKIRAFKAIHDKVVLTIQSWGKTEYIIECSKKEVTFTPLYVNLLAQDMFKRAKHVIFMSGTIIDHQQFARTLGVQDYQYIEVDSDFDPKASPILCCTKFNLNYKNLDEHLPIMVKLVEKICNDEHPNEKGIIHTHTFKITKTVQEGLGSSRRYLLREPGISNELILKEHKLSENPTVLISPSLGFGTDLFDDFGRFSIIMKTPYLPLGNKRIKILFDKNKRWYQMKALVNLVQMCGRTTRSKEDSSVTYILDGTAVNLIKMNSDRLPKWFLHRLR